MRGIIRKHINEAKAGRVWSALLGSGCEVTCWRSKKWPNDKLAVAWPNGNVELYEMVPRERFHSGDEGLQHTKCAWCGHPMTIPTQPWCGKCEGPK
jgi:hypothetical protein